MEPLEKIAPVLNEVEAMCLKGELQQREIPHVLQSYYDSALDGLFQFHEGCWGHVEAPAEYRNTILQILDDIRSDSSALTEEADADTESENAG